MKIINLIFYSFFCIATIGMASNLLAKKQDEAFIERLAAMTAATYVAPTTEEEEEGKQKAEKSKKDVEEAETAGEEEIIYPPEYLTYILKINNNVPEPVNLIIFEDQALAIEKEYEFGFEKEHFIIAPRDRVTFTVPVELGQEYYLYPQLIDKLDIERAQQELYMEAQSSEELTPDEIQALDDDVKAQLQRFYQPTYRQSLMSQPIVLQKNIQSYQSNKEYMIQASAITEVTPTPNIQLITEGNKEELTIAVTNYTNQYMYLDLVKFITKLLLPARGSRDFSFKGEKNTRYLFNLTAANPQSNLQGSINEISASKDVVLSTINIQELHADLYFKEEPTVERQRWEEEQVPGQSFAGFMQEEQPVRLPAARIPQPLPGAHLPSDADLRIDQLMERLGISQQTIERNARLFEEPSAVNPEDRSGGDVKAPD